MTSNSITKIDYKKLLGSQENKREALRQLSTTLANRNSDAHTLISSEKSSERAAKRKRDTTDEAVSRLISKCKRQKTKLEESRMMLFEENLRTTKLESELSAAREQVENVKLMLAAQKTKYRSLLADAATKIEEQEHKLSNMMQRTGTSLGPLSFIQATQVEDRTDTWRFKLSIHTKMLEFILTQSPNDNLIEYQPIHLQLGEHSTIPTYISDNVFFESSQLPKWLSKVIATLAQ